MVLRFIPPASPRRRDRPPVSHEAAAAAAEARRPELLGRGRGCDRTRQQSPRRLALGRRQRTKNKKRPIAGAERAPRP